MENPAEIAPTIIVGSIVIIFLAVCSMLFFVVFNNKKKKLLLEKERLRASYEKEILQSQVEIQEQTFNTISQEIHDNVGQILSLVKVQLHLMDEKESKDSELLADTKENVSKAMTDLRDVAKGLNSERIRVIGLVSAVEQEIQRVNRTGIVHAVVDTTGTEQKMDSHKQLILFRVIQECLQNTIKHAMATEVFINFNYSDTSLIIMIADNGKGFNIALTENEYKGLGLKNIYNRIHLIGGEAFIESTPHEGTAIKLILTYE